MAPQLLMKYVPLVALLTWAAVGDLRTRRIPNTLTFALALSVIFQSFFGIHTVTPAQSLLGFLSGFGLSLMMFLIGAVGGGDVKLLAGVGAWLGPQRVLAIFLLRAIIGMAMIITQAAWHGRLRTLFRNSAVVAINLVHIKDLGVDQVKETGLSCRSIDRPFPFAVPVLIAVVLLIAQALVPAGGH